ncbi:hypothetical protein EVAR_32661_1 [Eumeta japonica]|uniref:Uncharacterized protein n=1 Tax=Eumeta variegata TaxID=151549 RepID=A0A4C1WW72_EUMVA|nr:hypothetical protein EVAR_32661_1 [Eumeta japonica]
MRTLHRGGSKAASPRERPRPPPGSSRFTIEQCALNVDQPVDQTPSLTSCCRSSLPPPTPRSPPSAQSAFGSRSL